MPIKMLKLVDLDRSDTVQSRYETDPDTIARYQEIYESNEADFPPCIVFQEGEKYHVADGFQRIKALTKADVGRKLEYKTIACDVRQGTLRDAIVYSLAANSRHGLKPNTRDKQRTVMMYWGLSAVHCQHSSSLVGKACGTSHTFVADYRADVLNNLPTLEIFKQTRIPLTQIGNTILNLKLAEEAGEIITVRNGKELRQKASREGKAIEQATSEQATSEPLQMPLQESMTSSKVPKPYNQLYIITTTNSVIPRGTVIEGFESLTSTGNIAIDYEFDTVLVSSNDAIKIPFPIDSKIAPIDREMELTVVGYSLVASDLKIHSINNHGFSVTHSSTMLKPFVKKVLENPEPNLQLPQHNIDAAELPATSILDLLNLTDDELLELQFQVEQETLRRARLSEDTADLAIS
jgi:hypothetical protein